MFQLAQADINIERETYQQSRSGLNEMYLQVKRQFDSEVEHRKVNSSVHLHVIENGFRNSGPAFLAIVLEHQSVPRKTGLEQ